MKKMLSLFTGTCLVAVVSFAQTGDTTVHKKVTQIKTVTHHTTSTTQAKPAATHKTVHKTASAHPAAAVEVTTDSTSVHRRVKKPA